MTVDGSTSSQDFLDFYRREFAAMVVLAQAVSGDAGGGEDLAQEALTRAHQRWPEVSGYDKPGAWLRRVTINLAISRRRRVRAEARIRLQLVRADESLPQYGDPDVWRAVAKLPPRQRAVVTLFYLEDRSAGEIAEILDVSVSAATSNLHKARAGLAEILGEQV